VVLVQAQPDNSFQKLLSLTEDPRDDPFWKDDAVYCDVCGGNLYIKCHCIGGPRSPELHAGQHDESHRDDIDGD